MHHDTFVIPISLSILLYIGILIAELGPTKAKKTTYVSPSSRLLILNIGYSIFNPNQSINNPILHTNSNTFSTFWHQSQNSRSLIQKSSIQHKLLRNSLSHRIIIPRLRRLDPNRPLFPTPIPLAPLHPPAIRPPPMQLPCFLQLSPSRIPKLPKIRMQLLPPFRVVGLLHPELVRRVNLAPGRLEDVGTGEIEGVRFGEVFQRAVGFHARRRGDFIRGEFMSVRH